MTSKEEAVEINEIIASARDEARNEAILHKFRKYKKQITTLSIVFAAALIVYLIYLFFAKENQLEYSKMLHQAIIHQQVGDQKKYENSLRDIIEAKLAPSGVKSIASLRYAAILLSANKSDDAIKIYQEVSSCRSCNDYVREYAKLLLVKVMATDVKKDDELLLAISEAESDSIILKYYLTEQRALYYLKKKDFAKSKEAFELISKASDAPDALKLRAQNLLESLNESK